MRTIEQFKAMSHEELASLAYSLQDKANLFDHIIDGPTYISFYAGYNGQGGAFREQYFSKRRHHDGILERESVRKAKRIGACSFVQFKAIGVPTNIYYGRYGEESRLDLLEAVNE